MICSHRCSAEEGTSAPLLLETAEEVWNEPQHSQILLHLHCGEYPDRLHHRLVWKQHRWQPDLRSIRSRTRRLRDSFHQANEQSEITHLHHTPTHTTCHALHFNTVLPDYTHTLH